MKTSCIHFTTIPRHTSLLFKIVHSPHCSLDSKLQEAPLRNVSNAGHMTSFRELVSLRYIFIDKVSVSSTFYRFTRHTIRCSEIFARLLQNVMKESSLKYCEHNLLPSLITIEPLILDMNLKASHYLRVIPY